MTITLTNSGTTTVPAVVVLVPISKRSFRSILLHPISPLKTD